MKARLCILALGLTSCRLLIGEIEECISASDCASVGMANAECRAGFCVGAETPALDSRCQRYGGGSENAIRLGSILPLTRADGGINPTGDLREKALRLAFEQLNPGVRVGIRGRAIELLSCDSQSSVAAVAPLATNLIAQGIPALFTSTSADTLAASQVALQSGVLLMSVSASSSEITNLPDRPDGGVGLVWRTAAPDTFQANVIASVLVDAGSPRVALVQQDDAYGQGLAASFQARYPANRASTVVFPIGADVDATIGSAEALSPEVLLVITFADDAARLIAAAVTRGKATSWRFFVTDAARSPVLLSNFGNDANVKLMGTSPAAGDPQSEAARFFATHFSQRYGIDPYSVSNTAHAFDAATLIALAAYQATAPGNRLSGMELGRGLTRLSDKKNGHTVSLAPSRFLEAVDVLEQGGTLDISGASGDLDFDPLTGEAPGRVELWQLNGISFQTIDVLQP